jgi:hypothetical protein
MVGEDNFIRVLKWGLHEVKMNYVGHLFTTAFHPSCKSMPIDIVEEQI